MSSFKGAALSKLSWCVFVCLLLDLKLEIPEIVKLVEFI